MDRFLSSLKKWLKSSKIEQGDLADEWDENIKNLSAYVTGRLRMPDHLRTKFIMIGYQGPWPKEELEEWKERNVAAHSVMEEPSPSYSAGVTMMLPAHVEQAYVILCEVLDLKKKTPADGDRKAVARILGKAARELGRGTPQEEVRRELLADAELFLRILT